MPVTSQLRVYAVRPGQMDAFVDYWRAQIVPARLAHGYRIDGAWRDDAEERFTWVVTWDGPESWAEKEAAYLASPERTTVDPSPDVFLRSVETSLVDAVPVR